MTAVYRDVMTGQTTTDATFAKPDWTPPPPSLAEQRAGWVLTDIQFSLACADPARGWMTLQEAEKWVGPGDLPQLAIDAIALLPVAQQGPARVRFMGARIIERMDPFLPYLQAAHDPEITDAQLDAAFIAGAAM